MSEYDHNHDRDRHTEQGEGIIRKYERYMYGGNVARDRIEENSPNATISELDEDDLQILNLVDSDEKQELTPEDEREINQVFQAGIPTAIVGTYGTTLGTKVIWQSFAKVIAQRFGVVAAQALGLSAADGLLPVGDAIAFGLLAVTAWQIYRNWDELWRDAEQILVGQEPEPQIYTTPIGSQVETQRHTGHAPPEVETGTPGFDTESAPKTPNNTANPARELNPFDYIMESRRRNVEGHDAAGGHTRERHVGKSDQWIRNRQRNDDLKDSSSFSNKEVANLTQARFVKKYKKEINEWLKNSKRRKFVEEITMDRPVGTVISGKGKVKSSNRAKIVLLKDNSNLGYKILTSYPTP